MSKKNSPQNIIIFSAGKSDEIGNLKTVRDFLKNSGHNAFSWRELFTYAKDKDSIALLPTLLKKIPTFDFAVILGDGVDTLGQFRDKESGQRIMRDNVIFETGLCSMALSTERVILLVEESIRIPEDLLGTEWQKGDIKSESKDKKERKLGVKNISFNNAIEDDLKNKLTKLESWIEEKAVEVHPIVIGAAISTADGYLNNFVLRFWENIGKGFTEDDSKSGQVFKPRIENLKMRLLIPHKIENNTKSKVRNYFNNEGFRQGTIWDAEIRNVSFWFRINQDQTIEIRDIPTTVTASYNTVKDILDLSADDEEDLDAEERFLNKEMSSFVMTLNKLMRVAVIESKLRKFGAPEHKIRKVLQGFENTALERIEL